MTSNLVTIIDYGSGNLHSVAKAFERAVRDANLDIQIEVTSSADRVAQADKIVLPGVGAFADCRKGLDAVDGMVDALEENVIQKGRPFLGICVGTQLMAQRGLEKETTNGLGWIKGDVIEIMPDDPKLKIPQIGWNTIDLVGEKNKDHPLFNGIKTGPEGSHAYFVHSYHIAANENEIIATTNYGGPVTAIVGRDNIIGTQFHPEKSQKLGLAFITNFLKWKP
ncbi:MAG: imidazole glycerol phosphate synthase subunit HisH [Rhizobiales bacterium]|nr:imidazole glycerol phosphate synthase subunit HisH [Hyphomicrobiales bacterium]